MVVSPVFIAWLRDQLVGLFTPHLLIPEPEITRKRYLADTQIFAISASEAKRVTT
jgi:hypothetical protein